MRPETHARLYGPWRPARAVPTGLAVTPPLRRLALPGRLLVLGLLALPVPVGVAMWTAVMIG
ncbi:hypothetical protein PV682_40500 [Streptomyces niveiscabiei]|uniref:hypothetical protein n=1 Tax=Streptomyces niveiscabiei TaxID=164115 RepID=UPI0029B2C872|nr:hypothetical protein [Streptomyces niveiscabiei]MDX3387681.1 hypothetical protein [Streptomyces niveiscabiei]